jgi:hypothetical protein
MNYRPTWDLASIPDTAFKAEFERRSSKDLLCVRCGHWWLQRTLKPKQCPACRSPFWATERTRKNSLK